MAVAMGESHQYGPAILGIAGTGDCRDQPATRDGIYGNEFFGRGNRVWTGATGVGVGRFTVSPFTVRRSPFAVRRSPFAVHRSLFAVPRVQTSFC